MAPFSPSPEQQQHHLDTENSEHSSSSMEQTDAHPPPQADNTIHPLDVIPATLPKARQKVYSFDDLDAYELMPTAVWIFDVRAKSMWWANGKGLEFWGAESLQSLLDRDFAKGMSKAMERSNNAWLQKYHDGETNTMTWTFHPNGGRDGPKTCDLSLSGIYVSASGVPRKLCQLCVVQQMRDVKGGLSQHDITAKRRMEMLKHFPAVARQFNLQGNLMDQNTEALSVFGSPCHAQPSDVIAPPTAEEKKDLSEASLLDDETTPAVNDFLSQFVDVEEGKKIWDAVQNSFDDSHDYSAEILQNTLAGQVWFSICVRGVRDPVTSEPVVLYSARDISGIMRAAKEEAERQGRSKNEFFAVMAHEIRTPLHQVVGFIELLAESPLTEEQNDSVQMMQTSAQALIAIINDVLDFTKLEAGKMKLENIPFEVRGVINGCMAAVQRQIDSKGLALTHYVDRSIPVKLMGDPNRLRQILSNMLTNAVKFTANGELEITSERRVNDETGRAVLHFSVRDTGIGMSEEQQAVVFSPYQQADVSVSRTYGGTGLGLAICKSLVESMGGQIGVKSKQGEGSTFWFEVPFESYTKPHTFDEPLTSLSNHDKPASYRILVAEDNKVNQKVVKKMLEKLGHEVVVAENGQIAVEAIEKGEQDGRQFDCVLMDWQMPVMDGIDATKEIRNRGYNLVIIGLTASIQGMDWRQVGMNDCLKKPTRIADLRESLARNSHGCI